MESLINMVLLTLLAAVTIGVVVTRNIFGVVVLTSAYSFLMAGVLMVYDAVDVAMTEAAVGAGVSTVVLLSAMHLTQAMEYPKPRPKMMPLFVAGGTGAALVWATFDLPAFGLADTPMNSYLSPQFIARSLPETLVPNVVTSVLADYRGYDTMGETAVVFTAAIGVMLLLKGRRSRLGQPTTSGES